MRIKTAETAPQATTAAPASTAPPNSQTPASEPGSAIALIPALQTIVPSEFFKPAGSDAIIASLEVEVRKQAAELDISTPAGRKAIASLSFQVAKTKTGLDAARKELNSDMQEQIKAVNGEGNRVWERLEALQAEVRKPLTDWENADKDRIAAHEAAITSLQELGAWCSDNWQRASVEQLQVRLATAHDFERDWQEFVKRGKQARDLAEIAAAEAIERRTAYDLDQAELKRLRAEETARKERERIQAAADEAAAKERAAAAERAAEQARLADLERLRVEDERNQADARARQAEAERIAEAERARIAQEQLQAQVEAERAAAEAERERREREARETAARVERERVEAEERAAQALRDAEATRQREAEFAEQKRIAAQKEAERVLVVEREAAERRQAAAVQAERDRVAEEQRAAEAEREKRERNKKHRERIESAAIDAIAKRIDCLVPQSAIAESIVMAISDGLIPNITINY